MEATVPTSIGKKLWHMLRVMYYMFREGFSKHKLTVDLRLLFHRSKIAGKALGNFLHHHHHYHSSSATAGAAASGFHYSGFSCRSMDPNTSFYNPREVEFSCSNTPNFPALTATKRKNRHHYKCDAAAIAKAFEILNSETAVTEPASTADTPSPCPVFNLRKSPVGVRQLRITDSPFPIKEGPEDGRVDKEAEEFIRRFYEQLSLQQRITATPEYRYRREPISGRA